jgi:hypothetical protein
LLSQRPNFSLPVHREKRNATAETLWQMRHDNNLLVGRLAIQIVLGGDLTRIGLANKHGYHKEFA